MVDRAELTITEHGEPRLIYLRHEGPGLMPRLAIQNANSGDLHLYSISLHRIRLLLAELAQYNLKDIP